LYYYSVEPPKRDHTGTTTRWRMDTREMARGSEPQRSFGAYLASLGI